MAYYRHLNVHMKAEDLGVGNSAKYALVLLNNMLSSKQCFKKIYCWHCFGRMTVFGQQLQALASENLWNQFVVRQLK